MVGFGMDTHLSTAYGAVLKEYRNTLKWSQMRLAMESGLHLNALGNLERGERNPSLQTIFMICKALNVSVSEFMTKVETRASISSEDV